MISTPNNPERTVLKTCKVLCCQEVYNADESVEVRWQVARRLVGGFLKLVSIVLCESVNLVRIKKGVL
jgi:hypothetical protein